MLENDLITTVQEYLTRDSFYTEEHRLIYQAIDELSQARKPTDLYTVTERLKSKRELTKVGGATYLAQLTQKVGSAANIEFHARIIAQKYVQRELIRSAVEIQRRSYDSAVDVTDLIDFAESEILKITDGHVKRSVQSASDILRRTMLQIEEAGKNDSKYSGICSGFASIDNVTLVKNERVDVYTATGVAVRKGVLRSNATDGLPKGVYIVGGQKVLKK